MQAFKRLLSKPTGYLWVTIHVVILLFGMIFLGSDVQNFFGKGLSEGIGGSLIATGLAGLTLFLYVSATDTLKSRVEAFTNAGLLAIFPARSVRIRPEYDSRLAKARRIDLVGYGLSAFRQDYLKNFVEWSVRARVRILLLDPDFPTARASLADQRDREEGRPVGETRRNLLEFERAVTDLEGLRTDNFQVRRMRVIPAINMLRIDEEIFWGPYLMGEQSRNTPTFLISRHGFLFEVLDRHFEALWDQSHELGASA